MTSATGQRTKGRDALDLPTRVVIAIAAIWFCLALLGGVVAGAFYGFGKEDDGTVAFLTVAICVGGGILVTLFLSGKVQWR